MGDRSLLFSLQPLPVPLVGLNYRPCVVRQGGGIAMGHPPAKSQDYGSTHYNVHKGYGIRESTNGALKSNRQGQRILQPALTLIRFGVSIQTLF